ncbi:MAG: ABC transporter ATP-binding protein [Candidatus Methanomethyliaceae archaeon]|nr:ABC transporter ATP-binding protein [Candidatus Methanomethyliaceae archaeon]
MTFAIEALSKSFSSNKGTIDVIKDISLSIEEGQFLCIVGPSGCGKTTLLRIMCGLEPPTSGKVLINGLPPDPRKQKFGVIFQEDSLLPWRTVLGNVEFGQEIYSKSSAEVTKRYISLVGLDGFEDYYPYQISGGMKKRVALARALAVDPEIIMMDEPFADLDAQTRWILQKELLSIWSKLKKTVIFITHNVEEAVFLGQYVAILSKRPAVLRTLISINLPYPRSRLTAPFISYRERIIDVLRQEIPSISEG